MGLIITPHTVSHDFMLKCDCCRSTISPQVSSIHDIKHTTEAWRTIEPGFPPVQMSRLLPGSSDMKAVACPRCVKAFQAAVKPALPAEIRHILDHLDLDTDPLNEDPVRATSNQEIRQLLKWFDQEYPS